MAVERILSTRQPGLGGPGRGASLPKAFPNDYEPFQELGLMFE
jgi:hypothetical protein